MLWRSAPASPCGPLPPAPFHGRYAVGLCPQLSFQAVGLGFPLPLGKNMHGRIRRKRFWTGLRKAVGKSVSTAETAATESAGVIPPPPDQGCRKEAYLLLGRHPENRPRSSFFSRNSRYGFCSGTRTGIRSFGRGFDGSGRSLRSSGIRLRSILRGFGSAALGFAASESTDDPP